MAGRPGRAPRAALALGVAVLTGVLLVAVAPPGIDSLTGDRWVPPADAATTAEPTDHEGEIFSFGITVPADPIVVGDRITFPNNSDRPHTITDRGNTFDTGEIAPGTAATVTFDTPGRVQLYDEFREGETRRYDPADLKVDAGTEIVVANVGGLEHTLTAEDGSFTTGPVAPGDEQGRFAGTSATLVPEDGGTFAFFCEFFPDEMRGTLEVVAEPVVTTTTQAEVTTSTAAPPASTAPPDQDEAAAALPGDDDETDVGGLVGAALVVAVGLAAIAVALIGGPKKKGPVGEAF